MMKSTVKLVVISVTGIVLIVCVIISTLAMGGGRMIVSATSQQTMSNETKQFVLGERRGRLAVWRKGENEPFMTTDTLVYSLPKADRNKLGRGIEITGESELRKALEDYCS